MSRRDLLETSQSPTHSSGGWGNEVAQRLIHHAARNAPSALADRLEEEWLADLATRNGQTSRLLFGLGCCWATNIIAREHCALNVSATGAVTRSTTITDQAHPGLTFPPRRTSAVITIIGIHVAVIYALVIGLGHQFIERPQAPMDADVLRDVRPNDTPPPPPKVDLEHPPKLDLDPIPEIVIDTGPREDAINHVATPIVADLIPVQPTPAPVRRVLGGPGKGFPNSDDYYPPAARRLGEQGSTAIQVCVDPNGRLTAEPQVTRSSGSARLDEGAIKLARASSGHYRATTENGTPVSSCYGFLIKFNLQ